MRQKIAAGHHTYHLPTIPEPAHTRCFLIEIPDDLFYIAAFHGAVYNLSKPYTWANDNAHTALRAGARMFAAYQSIQEVPCTPPAPCGGGTFDESEDSPMYRISPTNPCVIQRMCPCDTDWTDWFDASTCVTNNIVDQAPGAVTQPPPGGTLAPGHCAKYAVTLAGNQKWLLPIPVGPGYTLHVTSVSGGWNDGSGLGGWYCPDGTPYVLGACIGARGHTTGDPSGTLYHAQLMANINGSLTDPLSGTITIPANGGGYVEFAMNDESLADNYGSISFQVEVCAVAASTWSHFFTGEDLHTTFKAWFGGQWQNDRWESTVYGGFQSVSIDLVTALPSAVVTQMRVTGVYNGSCSGQCTEIAFYPDQQNPEGGQSVPPGSYDITHTFNAPCNQPGTSNNSYPNTEPVSWINAITLWGTGTDPF